MQPYSDLFPTRSMWTQPWSCVRFFFFLTAFVLMCWSPPQYPAFITPGEGGGLWSGGDCWSSHQGSPEAVLSADCKLHSFPLIHQTAEEYHTKTVIFKSSFLLVNKHVPFFFDLIKFNLWFCSNVFWSTLFERDLLAVCLLLLEACCDKEFDLGIYKSMSHRAFYKQPASLPISVAAGCRVLLSTDLCIMQGNAYCLHVSILSL